MVHMCVRWCLCERVCYYVELHLILLLVMCLIQIWRTEYTRTQLPGPLEEHVSPGQEGTARTEKYGNAAGGKTEYACRYYIYKFRDDGSS